MEMTVKELIDRLDAYVKRDPPDIWMLNDVEADREAYQERCKERENTKVIVKLEGPNGEYNIKAMTAYGCSIPIDKNFTHSEGAFIICADMKDELK